MVAKKIKFMTKGEPKNHVEWEHRFGAVGDLFDSVVLDGTGNKELIEPVPIYFAREADKLYQGSNNTLIVMGRDRNPASGTERYSQNISERIEQSGYSDHMGAGAIDIVVGRGAPFPVDEIGPGKNFVLGPLYNTVHSTTLEGLQLIDDFVHPGTIMDASRIYISQMTDVDENFKIVKPIKVLSGQSHTAHVVSTPEGSGQLTPTSGIVIKSDKIRIHGRQNIKLVTRGPYETINSNGNFIGKSNIGIHLIANNGRDLNNPVNLLPQHPMVLGGNVEMALHGMCKIVEETIRVVNNVVTEQARLNRVLAQHFHLTATGPALWDIFSQIQGIITDIGLLVNGNLQCTFSDINIASFKSKFLDPNQAETYINSRYNTVN